MDSLHTDDCSSPQFVRLIKELKLGEAKPVRPSHTTPAAGKSNVSSKSQPATMVGPKVVGKPRMDEASELAAMRGELFKTKGGSRDGGGRTKPKTRLPDSPSPTPPPLEPEGASDKLEEEKEERRDEEEVNRESKEGGKGESEEREAEESREEEREEKEAATEDQEDASGSEGDEIPDIN